MATAQEGDPADDDINRFVYVTAAIAALNGLLFGFDTGVISGALLYIEPAFNLGGDAFLKELIVSGALVGAILGAAAGGQIADRIGRRRVILVAAVVFFVGSLAMAFAPGVWSLIGGRFVVGLGIGIASMVGPLYNSEIAPPSIRGSLVSLNQLAVTTGILMAYFVNYLFSGSLLVDYAAFIQNGDWRWMLGFGVFPAVILGAGMLYMPESPRWLVENGRADEARDVLSRIRDASSTEIDEEIEEIREVSEVEEEGDLSDLLEPWVRPALIVGVGLAVLQQVTGINTVIYYAPTILESTGFGNSASIIATVGIGIVNVLLTVVAVLLVDRVGRRPLLLVGLGGMTISLAGLSVAFTLPGLSGVIGYVALACLMLYVSFFAIGLGPVFWLLISEIYPLRIRGSAESVATVFNWAANLGVALTFLTLLNTIGPSATFGLYAAFSLGGILFVYSLVPETKGRSLEAIEEDLRQSAVGGDELDMADATADRSD